MSTARQVAFETLVRIEGGQLADLALGQHLGSSQLGPHDRNLVTELVYGCVRRRRTLDHLLHQFLDKPNQKCALDLRLLLHLGLYQLRYLSQIPASAAVHTTVELCRQVGHRKATGLVNAILRRYLREQASGDPLQLPEDPLERLGLLHSYPRWILDLWVEHLSQPTGDDRPVMDPVASLEHLSNWFNQPPQLDVRVHTPRQSREQMRQQFAAAGITAVPVAGLPQALRLEGSGLGPIPQLPGFADGWWMVQDASAQLVGHWLDPQPGETIVDACAAPGGKTLHLAELMAKQGRILAYDRTASRLKKLQENLDRLGLTCIELHQGDSRNQPHLQGQADRVLLDAPCSGLGTLHRHADARWRQTPSTVQGLVTLQQELLASVAPWVKPGGVLVYATCTLNPAENEDQIRQFLDHHPQWVVESPPCALGDDRPWPVSPEGWLTLWPHLAHMDGFFLARLRHIP